VHEATKDVSIVNVQGLHARPIMQFVDLASRFQASVRVTKGEQVVDGKSPMEIMLLEAVCGTQLTLSANGPDAREAIEALAALVAAGFDEI
jgi:phosphotransferase system HPr (HPr) family protein